MELSVIIPVYNMERYLRQCLDSVLAQRLKEMEVICVDDGSTDKSPQILAEYASRDKRVKIIRQKNAGLVAARKTGVQAAIGKYTGYVDSDDWIEPEMYEVLYGIAEQYGVDMVSSGYILEKGAEIEFYDGFQEGLYRGKELDALRTQSFFHEDDRGDGIRPSLCNKLFRTSMLKEVQLVVPDEVSNCEDRICTVLYMLEAKAVYILKKAFYHCIFHGESMSHHENLYYLDAIGKAYRAFRAMYGHPCFSEKLRTQCEMYIVQQVLHGLNEYMGFSTPDLMYINPGWIEKFPVNSKIVLYGAGRLGKIYYRQMMSDRMERLQLCGWVDRNYQNLTGYPEEVHSPEYLKTVEYDYVLLALMDKCPVEEAYAWLTNELGILPEKIVWLEQHEIFWEYAEAAGLLNG